MSIKIKFQKSFTSQKGAVAIYISEKNKFGEGAKAIDEKAAGFIRQALKKATKFSGKCGEYLTLALPDKAGFDQAVCIGIGKAGDLTLQKAEELGGKLYAHVKAQSIETLTLIADDLGLKSLDSHAFTAHLASGFELRSYSFDLYKAPNKDAKPFKTLNVIYGDLNKASKLFKYQSHVNDGVFFARDLVNEPPNELHPPAYAKRLKKELAPLGVKVDVLDEKKMKSLGMGAILAVGMGSVNKPRMVIMRWNGAASSNKKGPIALVGKGVTFDTGGISIKPSANMDQMKMDMGGSAAVVGAMKAIALNKVKANVIGVVGLAENMPSDVAYRPGDIIKSYSGKTIEVLNTDAEGRLVLSDCLAYVQKKYKPKAIIDLATLTGAMMVALGFEYAGAFASDDKLWDGLEKASAATEEKLWRMPLDDVWKKEMESKVADLQNLGSIGRFAGACTAAGFLQHFIEGDTPWAHLDIAGTAWIKKDRPTVPKHGTGFGVRVLEKLISDNYT